MSSDRIWRQCHPILAIFIGDYPKQTLVTCTYNGWCPKCLVTPDKLGESQLFLPCSWSNAIKTHYLADDDNVHAFHHTCHQAGLKPIYQPFWKLFPLSNIFVSVIPDILHQLLQEMIKHVIKWLVNIYGSAVINSCCKALPPNHKIALFTKRIVTLLWVSGQEHKRMCTIILRLIIDLLLPSSCIVSICSFLSLMCLGNLPVWLHMAHTVNSKCFLYSAI